MAAETPYLRVQLSGASLARAGRRVLSGIHWEIRPGQRWIVLGPNGSGKTQLLKLVAGIVRPTAARPTRLRWQLRGEWHDVPLGVRPRIAYLGPERQDKYERYGWNLVAEELVGTGLYGTDIPLDTLTAADRQQVRRLLERLGIGLLCGQRFLDLSYGQRRMVLLARALISRPALLVLDEVFTGLDAENHLRLMRWLARLRGDLPLVMATHEAADIPATATHALVLRGGRVVQRAAVRDIRGQHLRHAAPRSRAVHRPPRIAAGVAALHAPLVCLRRADVYLDGYRALTGVSMSVHKGEFWVIHGANGSGKTTLLRTIYGDHGVAAGGSIERAGIAAGVPLENFRASTGISAPYIHAAYPRSYTVRQVVLSGRHASIGLQSGFSWPDREAATRALRRLGLTRWAERSLAELSYGQARLVLFARALVRKPRLLLLDEPFDSVDVATRQVLARQLRRLAGEGVTIVITAHSMDEWRAYATHELEVAAGLVRYCGALRAQVDPQPGFRDRRAGGAPSTPSG